MVGMLARRNTDAASRLRRAKSLSSVPRSHPVDTTPAEDPLVKRRNAVAAATRAYERSYGLDHVDNLKRQRSQQDFGKTRQTQGKHFEQQRSKTPKVRQSWSAQAAAKRHGHRSLCPDNLSPTSPTLTNWTRSVGSSVCATPRPRSSSRFVEHIADSFSMPTPAIPDLQTPVVVPGKGSSRQNHGVEPDLNSRKDSPKSRNYHRSDPITEHGAYHTPVDDRAFREALAVLNQRNNSLNEQDKIPRKRRSFITLPFVGRRARESDLSNDASGLFSENMSSPDVSVVAQPRKLPSTLRKTLSRAFRRPSTTVGLPAQHIVAQREHFTRGPDIESSKRSSSHASDPADHDYQSPESSTSVEHGPSRVTSWANSSGRNTMVAYNDARSSQDENSKPDVEPISTQDFAKTIEPVKIRKRSSRFDVREIVDSRRVFSAVMKRIDIKKDSSRTLAVDEQYRNSSGDGATTIKLIPLEIEGEKYDAVISEAVGNREMQLSARYDVMSPSIYSERDVACQDNNEPQELDSHTTGTALVGAPEPVTTWTRMAENGSVKPNTSNDWRNWASDELAGFARATSLSLAAPFVRRTEETRINHRREKAEISNAEGTISEFASMIGRIPVLSRRSSQYGSRASSSSTSIVRTPQESISDVGYQSAWLEHASKPSPITVNPYDTQQPPPVPVHKTFPKKKPSFGEIRVNRNIDLSPIKEDVLKSPAASRYTSKLERHASAVSVRSSQAPRRAAVPQSQFDDVVMRRIRRGPYMPLTPSPNKENIPSKYSSGFQYGHASPKYGQVNCENTPPSGSRSMVDKFLESRGQDRSGYSPPAFL